MNTNRYRLDIEGLRAIAVLAVVGFHVSPNWVTGGFVGVDIFFVISGFLITHNIHTSLINNSFRLSDFYSRRVRRIFPALSLVLIFTATIGWFYFLALEYKTLGKHLMGASSFLENVLYFSEKGYFDESSLNKPLLQLWSLGIEEQFYLFWPVLLWFLHKLRINLSASVFVVISISFLCNLSGGVADSTSSFYLVQSRVWELGMGALLALPLLESRRPLLNKFTPYLGVFLILFSIFTFTPRFWFPGWWALIPTVGAFLIIYGNPDSLISKKFLSNTLLVWFGKISFPLYLWHWVLLSLAFVITPDQFTRTMRIWIVVISIALSWVTYAFLEKPFRKNTNTPKKLGFLLLTMLSIFCFGAVVYFSNGVPNRYFAKQHMEIEKAITDWQFPKGLIENSAASHPYLATSADSPIIAFVGDSHIDQYAPRVQHLFQRGKLKNSAFITFNGCPPIPGVFESKHPNCNTFIEKINSTLNALPSVNTVVISGCWNCYFGLETKTSTDSDANAFNYVYRTNEKEESFRSGKGSELAMKSLESYLNELSKKYKVYLILDNQMANENDPKQVIKNRMNLYSGLNLQSQLTLQLEQKNLNLKMKQIGERAGVTVLDPLHTLCPNDICPIFSTPGVPIFKDSHHLRSTYTAEHATYIDQIGTE